MKWEEIIKKRIKASDINISNIFIELLKENLENLPRTFNIGYFRNVPFLDDIKERVVDYVIENGMIIDNGNFDEVMKRNSFLKETNLN